MENTRLAHQLEAPEGPPRKKQCVVESPACLEDHSATTGTSGTIDPCDRLLKVISEVSNNVPHSTGGLCTMRLPGIVLSSSASACTNRTPVQFPLTQGALAELSQLGRRHPAFVGSGTPVWYWTAGETNLSNPNWDQEVKQLFEKAFDAVGIQSNHPVLDHPQLHKVLLFTPPGDAPYKVRASNCGPIPGLLATLWVFPPSKFTGGKMITRHGKETFEEYDIAASNCYEFGYVCLFGGASLQMYPLATGVRLCLVYTISRKQSVNLCKEEQLTLNFSDQTHLLRKTEELASSWSKALRNDATKQRRFLVIVLEHWYDPSCYANLKKGSQALRGKDSKVVGFFNEAVQAGADLDWDIGSLHRESGLETGFFLDESEQPDDVVQLFCLGKIRGCADRPFWSHVQHVLGASTAIGGIKSKDRTCVVIWPRSLTMMVVVDPEVPTCRGTVAKNLLKYLDESTQGRCNGVKHQYQNQTLLENIMEPFDSSPEEFLEVVPCLVALVVRLKEASAAKLIVKGVLNNIEGPSMRRRKFLRFGFPPLLNAFGDAVLTELEDWFVSDIAEAARTVIEWHLGSSSCSIGNKAVQVWSSFVEAVVNTSKSDSSGNCELAKSLGVRDSKNDVDPQAPISSWPKLGVGKVIQDLSHKSILVSDSAPRFVGAMAQIFRMDTRRNSTDQKELCESLFARSHMESLFQFPHALLQCQLAILQNVALSVAGGVFLGMLGHRLEDSWQSGFTKARPDARFALCFLPGGDTGVLACADTQNGDGVAAIEFVKRVVRCNSDGFVAFCLGGCNGHSPGWPRGTIPEVLGCLTRVAINSPGRRLESENYIKDFVGRLVSVLTSDKQNQVGGGVYARICSGIQMDSLPKKVHPDVLFNEILHRLDFESAIDFGVHCLEHDLHFEPPYPRAPSEDFKLEFGRLLIGDRTVKHIALLSSLFRRKGWKYNVVRSVIQSLLQGAEGSPHKRNLLLDFIGVCIRASARERERKAELLRNRLRSSDLDSTLRICKVEEIRSVVLGLTEELELGDAADFVIQLHEASLSIEEGRQCAHETLQVGTFAVSVSKRLCGQSFSAQSCTLLGLRSYMDRVARIRTEAASTLTSALAKWPANRVCKTLYILRYEYVRSKQVTATLGEVNPAPVVRGTLDQTEINLFLSAFLGAWGRAKEPIASGIHLMREFRITLNCCLHEDGSLGGEIQACINEHMSAGRFARAFSVLYVFGVWKAHAQDERCVNVVAKALNELPAAPSPEWTVESALLLCVLVAELEENNKVWSVFWNTERKPTYRLCTTLVQWGVEYLASLLEQAEVWFSAGLESKPAAAQFESLASEGLAEVRRKERRTVMTWSIPWIVDDNLFFHFLSNPCQEKLKAPCPPSDHQVARMDLRHRVFRGEVRYSLWQKRGGNWWISIKKLQQQRLTGNVPTCRCRLASCPIYKYHEGKDGENLTPKPVFDRLKVAQDYFRQLVQGKCPAVEMEIIDPPIVGTDPKDGAPGEVVE